MKLLKKTEVERLSISELQEYWKEIEDSIEHNGTNERLLKYLKKAEPDIRRRLKNAEKKGGAVIPFKKNHCNSHPINGQFLPLTYDGFFSNEVLMKKLANKSLLFLILLKNVVNWEKNEKLNLYQRYYIDRKLLVASLSKARLAKMLGVSARTIRRWTKSLIVDRLLRVERITCDDDDDERHKYNVYILAKITGNGKEQYFYENSIAGQIS